jgi:Plasmid pRiA4b ORF-3-like protein
MPARPRLYSGWLSFRRPQYAQAVGRAYVFRAELVDHPGIVRVVALAEEQRLEDLAELLREEFGWDDPHLYSFWLSGEFWDGPETEYTAPFELEEGGAESAEIPIADAGLEKGQTIAYLFDYGDEWRVEITVTEIGDAGEGSYPQVIERTGEAPPQYALDEDGA